MSLSTTGSILEVKIEFKDTNIDDNTPALVPNNEKFTSPLIPRTNPKITTTSVAQVSPLVDLPKNIYVKITLNTKDKHRATLSITKETD